jgi:hypothetical protein
MLPGPHTLGNLFTVHKHRRGDVDSINSRPDEIAEAPESLSPMELGNLSIHIQIGVVYPGKFGVGGWKDSFRYGPTAGNST